MTEEVFCKDCEHSFTYSNFHKGVFYCERRVVKTHYQNFVTGHHTKEDYVQCDGLRDGGECASFEQKKPKPPKVSWLKRLFTSNTKLAEQDGKLSIASEATGELSVIQ